MGLTPVESETNFVFVPIGPRAKTLCDELLHEGVIIRPLGWMGFPEAIRISVGSTAENTKLLGALEHALARPAGARVLGEHEAEFSNRPV
jgi:histidinol-phosphate aminotransferase